MWIDLFHGFDRREQIMLRAFSERFGERKVVMRFREDQSLLLPIGDEEQSESRARLPFEVRVETQDSPPEIISAEIEGDRLRIGTSRFPLPATFLNVTRRGAGPQEAQRFSKLSQEAREGPLIDALREEFPAIEDLSVEYSLSETSIWVKLKSLNRKIPLPLLSAGITSYLGILLAMAASPGSALLVDEIENGIHYSLHERVWRRILDFARRFDCQVFASTHSRECLGALEPVVAGAEDEFSLLRTERTNGSSVVEHFQGSMLSAALSQGVEVR